MRSGMEELFRRAGETKEFPQKAKLRLKINKSILRKFATCRFETHRSKALLGKRKIVQPKKIGGKIAQQSIGKARTEVQRSQSESAANSARLESFHSSQA